MAFTVLPLTTDGEATSEFTLGNLEVSITTRYNYSAQCWTMDLLDASGEIMLAGLMLVPNIDILKPYPDVKVDVGSLVLVEKATDDYKGEDSLGTTTQLLWFAPGEAIVLV